MLDTEPGTKRSTLAKRMEEDLKRLGVKEKVNGWDPQGSTGISNDESAASARSLDDILATDSPQTIRHPHS